MTLFTVLIFSESFSAGSSPDVSTLLFSSDEKRQAFIQDWITEHETYKHEQVDNELKFFSDAYAYWIEQKDIEIDCSYLYGKILKKY